jgi:hypothetical protein
MRLGQTNVPLNFLLPVAAVCLRKFSLTLRATVPEASVYENCDAVTAKSNIRLANYLIRILFPPTNAQTNQHGKEAFFKPCPLSLDGTHGFTPIFGRQIITHHFSKR